MSAAQSPDRSTFAVFGAFVGLIVTGAAALGFVFSAGDPANRAHWLRVAIAAVIGAAVGAYLGVTRRQFILDCAATVARALAPIDRALYRHRDKNIFALRLLAAALVITAWAVLIVLPDWRLHRIVGRLQSPNPNVSLRALAALEKWDCGRIVALNHERNRMVARLLTHDSSSTRALAVRSLSAFCWLEPPVRNAVPALIKVLDDPDSQARRDSAYVLARMHADALPATPTLTRLLNDSRPDVRCQAALALGAIGPGAQEAVPALAAMVSDSDEDAQCAAVEALGRIHSNAEVSVPALLEVFASENPWHHIRAADSLAEFGPQAAAAISILEQELAKFPKDSRFPHDSRRRSAQEALWRIDPAGHLPDMRDLSDAEGK
jgi:HEAT repeat protein